MLQEAIKPAWTILQPGSALGVKIYCCTYHTLLNVYVLIVNLELNLLLCQPLLRLSHLLCSSAAISLVVCFHFLSDSCCSLTIYFRYPSYELHHHNW